MNLARRALRPAGLTRPAGRRTRTDVSAQQRARRLKASPKDPSAASAYVHLPFCKRKCFYCDFPVVALGDAAAANRDPPLVESYVDLLLEEIRRFSRRQDEPRLPKLKTVFFGGGTPSLIPPKQLERILKALDDTLGVDFSGGEISIEMDPGTFDRQKLREYFGLGVNRVSMGVQVSPSSPPPPPDRHRIVLSGF